MSQRFPSTFPRTSTLFSLLYAYLSTFFSFVLVVLSWFLGLLLPWFLHCGSPGGNFFHFHPPHNLLLLVLPEVLLLSFVLLFFLGRLLLRKYRLTYFTLPDIYRICNFSTYVGFFPYVHQWLGLWLILWGVPIYMAMRSYHVRSTYLPESWDPLSLLPWFPPHLGEFLLPLLCLSLPLSMALWELLTYRSQFFLSLQIHYFWLLVRINHTPLGKVLTSLQKFVVLHTLISPSIFLLRFLPDPRWIYKVRNSLWIWVVVLPLDFWVHRGLLVWSLSLLPYWTGLLLVWKSFVFLDLSLNDLHRWTAYFYGPPEHHSPESLRYNDDQEVGLYSNRGHSLRCYLKYRSIYAKKKK